MGHNEKFKKDLRYNVGFYNGWADDHYSHVLTEQEFPGVDLHDDVGDVLTPVFSENGTYSTQLFSEKAIEIIMNHNPEQVSGRSLVDIAACLLSDFHYMLTLIVTVKCS